jgi:hypothetical protein
LNFITTNGLSFAQSKKAAWKLEGLAVDNGLLHAGVSMRRATIFGWMDDYSALMRHEIKMSAFAA